MIPYDSDDDEYPSAREALMGNDHDANLYCALKWGVWHLFHAWFTLVLAAIGLVFIPLLLLFRLLLGVEQWLAERLDGHITAEKVPSASKVSRPTTPSSFAQRVRETPVARRVYGECPVDIETDPRWFSAFQDRVERLVVRLGPTKTVYVCDRCGREFSEVFVERREGDFHHHCDGNVDPYQVDVWGDG